MVVLWGPGSEEKPPSFGSLTTPLFGVVHFNFFDEFLLDQFGDRMLNGVDLPLAGFARGSFEFRRQDTLVIADDVEDYVMDVPERYFLRTIFPLIFCFAGTVFLTLFVDQSLVDERLDPTGNLGFANPQMFSNLVVVTDAGPDHFENLQVEVGIFVADRGHTVLRDEMPFVVAGEVAVPNFRELGNELCAVGRIQTGKRYRPCGLIFLAAAPPLFAILAGVMD